MPTRNVVLTDHQSATIERLVSSGRYQNASEVLREGIRLIEGRDAEDEARLESLRQAASDGIADIDAGRFQLFEDRAGLHAHLKTLGEDTLAEPTTGSNADE